MIKNASCRKKVTFQDSKCYDHSFTTTQKDDVILEFMKMTDYNYSSACPSNQTPVQK